MTAAKTRWSIGAAIANYQPTPGDAPAAVFSRRVQACRDCRHQVAGQCRRSGQLCAVMARVGLSCPAGKWDGPLPASPPPPALPRATRPADVDVIIPCHNYGRFLGECLDSVLASTIKPRAILVVDDASTDDTADVAAAYRDRGVHYLRVECRSALRARSAGFKATAAPFVMFLDADDVLDAQYLEQGLAAFRTGVGIVNSDFEFFGDETGRRALNFDHCRIHRFNSLHAGSVYRRDALDAAQAMDVPSTGTTHEDWIVGRAVISRGWKVAKNPIPYFYRKHAASMMQRLRADLGRLGFAAYGNLMHERITIFSPLSGRRFAWRRLQDWIAKQTWPRGQCELFLADCGTDADFAAAVRNWLPASGYDDFRFSRFDVGQTPGLADRDRRTDPSATADVRRVVARIYSRMAAELATELVFVLEDDVIPPLDAIARLCGSLDERTVSVSGAYRSRFRDAFVAHGLDGRPIVNAGDGVEIVGGHGFGCCLTRRSVLQQFPIHTGERGDYDLTFCSELRAANLSSAVDWTVRCDHLSPPA